MTTVFATPSARRYHSRRDCRALEIGQDLNDWDCPDDYCSHRYHAHPGPVLEYLLEGSVVRHREPCRVCKPPLPPALEAFGHRVISIDGDWFCARCVTRGTDEYGDPWVYPTVWPCATTRVLRPEVSR